MRREKARCRMFSTAATKLFALGVITLACFLALAESVNATPVYSQNTPAEPGSTFSSNDTLTGQKIADNFLLTGPNVVTIRSLRFIGAYGNNSPPPLNVPFAELPNDNFRISFLEDSGGSPGTLVAGGDFPNASVLHRVPTNGQLIAGGFTPVEISVNLGDGIILAPNTDYWVSITNNLGPSYSWLWARANGVIDQKIAGTNAAITTGPWSISTSGGMWFEMNDQIVPEPSSLRILLIAAAAVMMRSRQQ